MEKPTAKQVLENLKQLFVEVDNEDLRQIKEYCLKESNSGTGINAIPENTDYANGWNDCRKEAFEMKREIIQTILNIVDSDLAGEKK